MNKLVILDKICHYTNTDLCGDVGIRTFSNRASNRDWCEYDYYLTISRFASTKVTTIMSWDPDSPKFGSIKSRGQLSDCHCTIVGCMTIFREWIILNYFQRKINM